MPMPTKPAADPMVDISPAREPENSLNPQISSPEIKKKPLSPPASVGDVSKMPVGNERAEGPIIDISLSREPENSVTRKLEVPNCGLQPTTPVGLEQSPGVQSSKVTRPFGMRSFGRNQWECVKETPVPVRIAKELHSTKTGTLT